MFCSYAAGQWKTNQDRTRRVSCAAAMVMWSTRGWDTPIASRSLSPRRTPSTRNLISAAWSLFALCQPFARSAISDRENRFAFAQIDHSFRHLSAESFDSSVRNLTRRSHCVRMETGKLWIFSLITPQIDWHAERSSNKGIGGNVSLVFSFYWCSNFHLFWFILLFRPCSVYL